MFDNINKNRLGDIYSILFRKNGWWTAPIWMIRFDKPNFVLLFRPQTIECSGFWYDRFLPPTPHGYATDAHDIMWYDTCKTNIWTLTLSSLLYYFVVFVENEIMERWLILWIYEHWLLFKFKVYHCSWMRKVNIFELLNCCVSFCVVIYIWIIMSDRHLTSTTINMKNSNIPSDCNFRTLRLKAFAGVLFHFKYLLIGIVNVFVNNNMEWLHAVKTSIWLTKQDNKVAQRNSLRRIPDILTSIFIRINSFFSSCFFFISFIFSFKPQKYLVRFN